ncbi:MAG TPA: patatin-like phospholipase family protein [Sphaerochaeta sp.]|nr:patatin-like phospholipase family protein [Sphaerochaeta sp.]
MKRRASSLLVVLLCSFSLFASRPSVALVLSGGGARGLAHIAVIEALERYGIPIDMVVGTSMGALVGSLYAAGYSPLEIRALAADPNFSTLFLANSLSTSYDVAPAFEPTHSNVFSLGFDKQGFGTSPGLLGDQMVMGMLSSVFSKLTDFLDFDDLEIPFRCIGANVVNGEKIIYEKGSLITAVRSSISIPIVFTPYPQLDGSYAVDGGIVDNLPIQVAKDLGYDIVIACDVNASIQSVEALLGSLSSMVMQTMTLVTQIKAQSQYPLADLMIFPELSDILVLDFTKHQQIISKGEEACEDKASELSELASLIAADRPLVVREEGREGTYLAKDDPTIAIIRVVDVSLFPAATIPQEEHFSQFVGRKLDDATKRELTHSLALVKKHYRLSSATYQMSYIKKGKGVLVVHIQSSKKSESNISLGLSGSTGVSNNTPNGDVWLSADARVNARISNMMDSKFSLEILASLGQTSKIRTSLLYPFYTSPSSSLDLDFSFTYMGGGFTPLNSMVNGQRVVSLDKGFSVDLSMAYRFLDYGRLGFGGLVDVVYLYGSAWNPPFLTIPSLYASLVWDTQLSTFASSGVRGEYVVSVGLEEDPNFGMQGAWRHRFSIGGKSSLEYNVHLAMMRLPYQLLTSYVDLGGLSAFPGYSAGSLKRDIALVGGLYQHNVGTFLGFKSFVQVTAKIAMMDLYDPYQVPTSPCCAGFWLSSGFDVDAGMSVGLGLQTPLGDVIVRLGASILGQVSLAIEIL